MIKNFKLLKSTTATFALCGLLLFATVTQGLAQQNFKRLGKSGFTFLKIGQGARAVAMGDAYTAAANDPYAIFWNPAGLTHVEHAAFGLSLTNWIVGSKLMSAAGSFNIGPGVIGLSVISFTPEDFEETTISAPEGTGRTVHTGDLAIAGAFALQFTNKLSFGIKGQWIQETIDRDKATGFTVDFSTFYYTGFRDLVLAMAFKNFGPEATYLNEKFKMPMYFNINAALGFIGHRNGPFYFLLSGESAFATDYRDRYHTGAELWILDTIALRGGYKFYYDLEDYSLGLGLKVNLGGRKFTFDIAYTHVLEYFEAPVRFSFGGEF